MSRDTAVVVVAGIVELDVVGSGVVVAVVIGTVVVDGEGSVVVEGESEVSEPHEAATRATNAIATPRRGPMPPTFTEDDGRSSIDHHHLGRSLHQSRKARSTF
jgi:hypothetical protein